MDLMSLIVAATLAAVPPATFTATIDGVPDTLIIEGVEQSNGAVTYTGSTTIGDTFVSCSFVYATSLFGPAVYITGNVYADHLGESDADVELLFDLPICRVEDTVIGGLSSVTLYARDAGGKVACLGENDWFSRTVSDGVGTFDLFQCPTELEMIVPGVSYANMSFGSPIPSLAGPAEVTSLGLEAAFVVTEGDAVQCSVTYAVDGTFEAPPCPADLDSDGVVGRSDLGLLLAAWGTPDGDVNGDGLTDGDDLGLLLAALGPCGC